MANQQRTIVLSKDQRHLLNLIVEVLGATSTSVPFTCMRLRRLGFTWIIHPELDPDVPMAHWDDVLILNHQGLIELHGADADQDACSFDLTPLAIKVHRMFRGLSEGSETINIVIEDEASNPD